MEEIRIAAVVWIQIRVIRLHIVFKFCSRVTIPYANDRMHFVPSTAVGSLVGDAWVLWYCC
jgi:hypothetical protein